MSHKAYSPICSAKTPKNGQFCPLAAVAGAAVGRFEGEIQGKFKENRAVCLMGQAGAAMFFDDETPDGAFSQGLDER